MKTQIAAKTAQLIADAKIDLVFPDVWEKPLEWQIALVGMLAKASDDLSVAEMCNDMLSTIIKYDLTEQGINLQGKWVGYHQAHFEHFGKAVGDT